MSAYDAWHQALRELTGDEQRFASWREQRYAFAYRIGVLLTEAHPPCPAPVSGHAKIPVDGHDGSRLTDS
jgi:hypothetical protein